mgnify:CR=1 FL=1
MCIRDSFSAADIEIITAANLGLDVLAGQIGHPEYHFDDSACLLYTSDAADERSSVDLGGRRIIKKKKNETLSTAGENDRK